MFQGSSLSLANARNQIVESTGSSSTELKLRAERALQWALSRWNRAAYWNWTKTIAPSITITGGTTTYDLPYDLRAMYNVKLAGGVIYPVNTRQWEQVSADTSASAPLGYDLFRQGATGKIELLGAGSLTSGDALDLRYYRRLALPMTSITASASASASAITTISLTAGSAAGVRLGAAIASGTVIPADTVITAVGAYNSITISNATSASGSQAVTMGDGDNTLIDFPEDYELGLLALARYFYTIDKGGGERSERAKHWRQLGAEIMLEALRAQGPPDEELVFAPAGAYEGARFPDLNDVTFWTRGL